ncbi:MAG: protein translocase subunit SecF [Pseudomonadota bacterium]|jgi:preprotein translocase subunit SecF
MGKRRIAAIGSAVLILISLISLLVNSLQFGLDFTSGIAVRLTYSRSVTTTSVQETLRQNGFPGAQVVSFGSERDIRVILQVNGEDERSQAQQALETGEELAILLSRLDNAEVTLQGSDFVSAKAGADLAEKSGLGLLVALGLVMVYITVRFQFKFAVGAVAALAHDVIITIGWFSLFKIPFELPVLAALLAVIGYSLNDTIIVMDRIRENFRRSRSGNPVQLVNLSVNQTLSRTLVTSGTTLLVVVVLLLFAGEAARGFAIALTVGIGVGTYSSIYIASAVTLAMNVTREDLALPVKEGAEIEGRP